MMHEQTDFQKRNREKLVAYFTEGQKSTRLLGFDLEHILLRTETNAPVSYSEPQGIKELLERIAPAYHRVVYENGNIVGLERPGVTISLGPAGQIEFSAGPFANVEEIERAYLAFRACLDPVLDEFGIVTPMLGCNPSARARDLELVPRVRYSYLDEFLGKQAYEAVCMMRATASLQVTIDYDSEADAMRKLRFAEIIAPIIALLCDNSPLFETEERSCQTVRTHIWTSMNPDRVGTIAGSLSPEFSFADYADYIMTREAILIPDASEPSGWRFVGDATFDELYADREMTDAEIEHALSMVWPDARLKNIIEVRPADAMPIEYCFAFAVLMRAIFYSPRNLGVLESLLSNVDEDQIAQAKAALMEKGYGANIYGRSVEFWVDMLMVLASGSLQPGEFIYLEPLASMARYRFTLAEIWPRLMEKRNHMPEGSPDAPIIGVVPRYDFEWAGLAISDGYLSGLLEAGAVPIVLPLTDDPAHIAHIVSVCDGFLIPGGQDIDPARYGARREPRTHRSATARDAMEQALVRAAIAADKPLLGICRGMQSLNVALGGTLHQDVQALDLEGSFAHVQGRPFDLPSHMVEVDPNSLLFKLVGAERLGVNTIHHQSVDKLGEGLVVTAVSPDDGIIEGIEMPDAHFVVGVQWHPEHMWRTRPHSKRLFGALVRACTERRS